MDINPEQIYELEDKVLVDIRSPSEYAEFHIPGAVNVPLFEDEEKRLIGLVYRQEGVERAKSLGYQIATAKLDRLIDAFRALKEKHRNVVVYCWRGGLRSQELCKVLQSLGIEVFRLSGGYRAYREYILKDMERLLERKRFLVLTGRTGVGKTLLLRWLKEDGFPVVDLEELAKDRGSVFGKVGIRERVSQKMFDALLYESLRSLDSELIFTEDESRSIGNVHLPEAFWRRKEEGIHVEVCVPLSVRVKNLIEEYTRWEGWQEEVKSSLAKIRKYLGEARYMALLDLLEKGMIEEFARLLIEEYYDRTYKVRKSPHYRLECEDTRACYEKLKELYARLLEEGVASKFGR